MALVETINTQIKEAMLSRDKVRLEALRGIKKEFLEAMTAKGAAHTLEDDQALKIIQKLVKQREDSAQLYQDAGRAELAERELAEAKVLSEFLPAQLSREEVEAAIKQIIAEVGATSMKDMGRVMGIANKQLGTQAEGKLIADVVKALLAQ